MSGICHHRLFPQTVSSNGRGRSFDVRSGRQPDKNVVISSRITLGTLVVLVAEGVRGSNGWIILCHEPILAHSVDICLSLMITNRTVLIIAPKTQIRV